MEKKVIEDLKKPMLQCLGRVVREIEEQLQYWNKKVMEEAGIDLGLEFVSASQVNEDKWVVRVKGNTWTKSSTENIFTVAWMSDVCPAHFHLFQRGYGAWCGGIKDLYQGAVDPNSKNVAKELAIYSYSQQIPGVLSR